MQGLGLRKKPLNPKPRDSDWSSELNSFEHELSDPVPNCSSKHLSWSSCCVSLRNGEMLE